ncbi:MAG: hypothetical protein EOO62_26875 [Hymenobacter sp.]|nr:MAG: hypothetical protein EOO62_26875 [Hymenobacter sp.]
MRYLLAPRGTARPTSYPNAQGIEMPIRSMVALSSMHVVLADLAHFLRDTGSTYYWDRTPALALSFEAGAPVTLSANYWLQTGTLTSRAGLLAQHARYAAFAPVKNNRNFNNNLRTNTQGSNDYWESGAMRPDPLKILHPKMLPTWTLRYYQPLQ